MLLPAICHLLSKNKQILLFTFLDIDDERMLAMMTQLSTAPATSTATANLDAFLSTSKSAFDKPTNAIKPVDTAIPAFIGYTPKAELNGKSYLNKPVKISSFAQFQEYFLFDLSSVENAHKKQYQPSFYLVPQEEVHSCGKYILVDEQFYAILPDPSSIYYFYNSIRLFFQNGGVDAYIVSIGTYGNTQNTPLTHPKQRIINPNVRLHDLLEGLAALQNEPDPTMYVCPEATLLSIEDNATLMQAMLVQAQEMQTTICLFDVIGGDKSNPSSLMQDAQIFRNSVGNNGLNHGVSYYPFIGTSLMKSEDIDLSNICGGKLKMIAPILAKDKSSQMKIAQLIEGEEVNSPNKLSAIQRHKALQQCSPIYAHFTQSIIEMANIVPASSAMAGVFANNDRNAGVWHDPDNINLAGTNNLPIALNAFQQSFLHADAQSGKSINSLHFFSSLGVLIWGAKTLDGKHPHLQSISAQRTASYIQKSIQNFANNFSHYPNVLSTWSLLQTSIEHFLDDIWSQGGLIGAHPNDAFKVQCGNSVSLCQKDIPKDHMRITIHLALTHAQQFHPFSIDMKLAF
jgi:phage tail sheath protein FI